MSLVLWETLLIISVSTGEAVSVESDAARVVSLSTTEISGKKKKKNDKKSDLKGQDTLREVCDYEPKLNH